MYIILTKGWFCTQWGCVLLRGTMDPCVIIVWNFFVVCRVHSISWSKVEAYSSYLNLPQISPIDLSFFYPLPSHPLILFSLTHGPGTLHQFPLSVNLIHYKFRRSDKDALCQVSYLSPEATPSRNLTNDIPVMDCRSGLSAVQHALGCCIRKDFMKNIFLLKISNSWFIL